MKWFYRMMAHFYENRYGEAQLHLEYAVRILEVPSAIDDARRESARCESRMLFWYGMLSGGGK